MQALEKTFLFYIKALAQLIIYGIVKLVTKTKGVRHERKRTQTNY
jgi:hypothetical protein